MKKNVVQEKSFLFAIRVINLYKFLAKEKKEYVISKQLLRSGTSVGANIEEAIGGQSRKDFLFKMSIAYKEARESRYWLSLLKETGYIDNSQFRSIVYDCDELCKIIGKIQLSTKNNS